MLKEGELVCIFPEGSITKDGELQPFKAGVQKIIQRAQDEGLVIPVIPMALTGLWGSFFSRKGGPAMRRPLRRGFWNKVELKVSNPEFFDSAVMLNELEKRTKTMLDHSA